MARVNKSPQPLTEAEKAEMNRAVQHGGVRWIKGKMEVPVKIEPVKPVFNIKSTIS